MKTGRFINDPHLVFILQLQHFLLPCTSQTSDGKRCISCRPRSQSFFKSLLVSWIFSMLAHTSNLFPSSSSVARSSFSSLDFKPSLTCCLQNSFQTTRGALNDYFFHIDKALIFYATMRIEKNFSIVHVGSDLVM